MRAIPLALISVGAFGAGVIVSTGSDERDAVNRFGDAWAQGDYAAMYAELSPSAKQQYPIEAFQRRYTDAQAMSTAQSIDVGDTRGPLDQNGESVVALDVSVPTKAFGTVSGEIGVPVSNGAVDWRPDLVFPGLSEGDHLDRETKLSKRAPILAADRSVIAEGPVDARTTTGTAGIVTGEIGKPKGEQATTLEAEGFPDGSLAGTSGLELAFDTTLAGTPGGKLLAVGSGDPVVLAQTDPVPGAAVRTTLDPKLQDATASALGGTFGGAALLDAKNGDILALAGLAFSGPQPPGSTMKVITATGALDAGITKLSDEFPVVSSAIVGGREVSNAHDELCGGTLIQSFAQSCNSVFGPLGEKLGGKQLVDFAEAFGFNSPPSLYNASALAAVAPPESTIPHDLSDAEAGISAIGQGEVLATPLEMASVAQTISNDGVRSPNSLVRDKTLGGDYPDVKVTTPEVAGEVEQMMIEVVRSGTGVAAALPGITVAGKTGTAELGTTTSSPDQPIGDAPPEQDVDAWFTAYAPAEKPQYAVAVLVVNAGADGGTVAAPIARAILDAAL